MRSDKEWSIAETRVNDRFNSSGVLIFKDQSLCENPAGCYGATFCDHPICQKFVRLSIVGITQGNNVYCLTPAHEITLAPRIDGYLVTTHLVSQPLKMMRDE